MSSVTKALGSVRQEALMRSLDELLIKHAHPKPRGPFRSLQRATDARRILERGVNRLWVLGYHLEHISQLTIEHLDALEIDWRQCGYSPSAIANYASAFGRLGDWLGVNLRRRNRHLG